MPALPKPLIVAAWAVFWSLTSGAPYMRELAEAERDAVWQEWLEWLDQVKDEPPENWPPPPSDGNGRNGK